MKRLSLSVGGAIVILAAMLVIVLISDASSSELPLLERNPAAWVIFWPSYFFEGGRTGLVELGIIIYLNLFIYAMLVYTALWWRGGRRVAK